MAELNLIPYQLKKKKSSFLGNGGGIIVLVVLIVIAVGAIGYPVVMNQRLASEEARLKDEVDRSSGVLKESENLKKSIDSYNQYISTVDKLTKLSPRIEPRVRGLEKYIVGDIAFESLGVLANGVLTISASAKDYNSITVFAANLQESEDYKGTRILNINYNKDNANYSFSITVSY